MINYLNKMKKNILFFKRKWYNKLVIFKQGEKLWEEQMKLEPLLWQKLRLLKVNKMPNMQQLFM